MSRSLALCLFVVVATVCLTFAATRPSSSQANAVRPVSECCLDASRTCTQCSSECCPDTTDCCCRHEDKCTCEDPTSR